MVYRLHDARSEGDGVARRYKIMKAGNALNIEEVDRLPFVTFSPLPIPHSFYGSNFAEKLCDTQNARTVLTRSIGPPSWRTILLS